MRRDATFKCPGESEGWEAGAVAELHCRSGARLEVLEVLGVLEVFEVSRVLGLCRSEPGE